MASCFWCLPHQHALCPHSVTGHEDPGIGGHSELPQQNRKCCSLREGASGLLPCRLESGDGLSIVFLVFLISANVSVHFFGHFFPFKYILQTHVVCSHTFCSSTEQSPYNIYFFFLYCSLLATHSLERVLFQN